MIVTVTVSVLVIHIYIERIILLDNNLQKGSGEVRINNNAVASVQTYVERGWKVVSRKKMRTKNV